MSRELGDNIYKDLQEDPKVSFLKRYAEQGADPMAVYQSDVAGLKSKADFYGEQAGEYGKMAAAHEDKSMDDAFDKVAGEEEGGDTAANIAKGFADGKSPVDAIGGGLMMSGNPYAMGAGAVLKVASMGQQRQQKQNEAARAAYIDRQNRLRDVSDKIMSANYGV
jgi:hypothetical protein